MIEVEAKIRVSDPNKFLKKITSIAKYERTERKIDDYYTLEDLSHYPRKSLRIRKKGNFYEINFKQRISYIKGVHAKKETEFKVSNIDRFLNLIRDFGFKKWLRKEKVTKLYRIRNNFHIELNNVKGLGWFLEIEYLADMKNIERARKEVLDVVKKLGFGKKDLISEGYTKMLWDKGKR